MTPARLGQALAFTIAMACPLADASFVASAQPAPAQSVMEEKAARTAAQKKINSQLLYALYARRGESERRGTPTGPFPFEIDPRGRVLIDIRADVTDTLLDRVRTLGGEITTTSVPARSILARFPLDHLEHLASLDAVKFIEPAPQATLTH
jgi:hypothetical protein